MPASMDYHGIEVRFLGTVNFQRGTDNSTAARWAKSGESRATRISSCQPFDDLLEERR